jgi:hypothetical protein
MVVNGHWGFGIKLRKERSFYEMAAGSALAHTALASPSSSLSCSGQQEYDGPSLLSHLEPCR